MRFPSELKSPARAGLQVSSVLILSAVSIAYLIFSITDARHDRRETRWFVTRSHPPLPKQN
jgi:hypothetical protein